MCGDDIRNTAVSDTVRYSIPDPYVLNRYSTAHSRVPIRDVLILNQYTYDDVIIKYSTGYSTHIIKF